MKWTDYLSNVLLISLLVLLRGMEWTDGFLLQWQNAAGTMCTAQNPLKYGIPITSDLSSSILAQNPLKYGIPIATLSGLQLSFQRTEDLQLLYEGQKRPSKTLLAGSRWTEDLQPLYNRAFLIKDRADRSILTKSQRSKKVIYNKAFVWLNRQLDELNRRPVRLKTKRVKSNL